MDLRQYLTESKTSIPAFAAEIDVTVQAVHRYLTGERTPRLEVAERIREATGGKVQPNDMFDTAQRHAASRAGAAA